MPQRGELLAVGDQRRALLRLDAVEPEYLVVGAGIQGGCRRLVEILALPDADALQRLDDQRRVVVGEIDRNAAAVAIDGACEVDAVGHRGFGGVQCFDGGRMTAVAAGIEIAGAVAERHAEPERIVECLVLRYYLGGYEELHGADFLQRMRRQMRSVVAPHKAGVGLRLGHGAGEHARGERGVGLLQVVGRDRRSGNRGCGADQQDKEGNGAHLILISRISSSHKFIVRRRCRPKRSSHGHWALSPRNPAIDGPDAMGNNSATAQRRLPVGTKRMEERTRVDCVANARALAPVIAAAAPRIEANRELPADLVDALHEARLWRMLLPRSYGGDEVSPVDYVQAIEEIAKADASTAWCIGQTSVCGTISRNMKPEIAEEMFK